MTRNQWIVFGGLGILALGLFLHYDQSQQREPVERVEIQTSTPEIVIEEEASSPETVIASISTDSDLPQEVDRMTHLFLSEEPKFPFIERVRYSSRVSWLTGRRAYIGDFASHYKTSKHFISASLHGLGVYRSDKVSQGDAFNVIKKESDVEFHLALDLSRCRVWVYAYEPSKDTRYLLKSYPVCVGALDSYRKSGCNTPCGVFSLGEEIAVYQEGMEGQFKNQIIEMVSVFGKRWIPLQNVIEGDVVSCKGIGLHGAPWDIDENGNYFEKRECIGGYHSNGCIRFYDEDIKEIFALIVSRPSYIHIQKDFTQCQLPGSIVF